MRMYLAIGPYVFWLFLDLEKAYMIDHISTLSLCSAADVKSVWSWREIVDSAEFLSRIWCLGQVNSRCE